MTDPAKRAAGRAAVELIEDGMRLGLGTGSTVAHLLDGIVERGLDVAGVPTSAATAQRCRELGIRLLDPADADGLDLCIDGADELDRDLSLTKGGGGALLREKVVATMADRMVVIATPDKVVDRLAATFALPIEVVPFAIGPVTRALEQLGFQVAERGKLEGWRTDNGNAILDATMPEGLDSPGHTEHELAHIPGIAESGLFVGLADLALLGRPDGDVERLTARH